jgi:hypothetical protein
MAKYWSRSVRISAGTEPVFIPERASVKMQVFALPGANSFPHRRLSRDEWAAVVVASIVVVSMLPSVASARPVTSVPQSISTQITPNLRIESTVPVPDLDARPSHAVPINLAPPMSMSVLLTLPYSNQSELSSLLEAIQTPGGPDYHHYLTGAQFDSEFGGSPQTYSALAGLLASYGVTAVTTRADRASLSFLATGTEVSEVFHTQIGVFRTENGWVFYAPRTAPQLPTTLVDASVSVQGLSNYSNYLVSTDLETSHMPGGGTADRPSPPPPANRQAICNSDLLGAINYTSVGGYSYPEPVDGSKWGCGQYIFGSDLQVTYGVTPLYARGSPPPGPTNVSIATLLWTEPVYATGYCTGVSTYDNAWDFYAPDVSTYFADTLPSGEPQPHVASMATPVSSPYSYYYPAGSQGESATCAQQGADVENTLDVEMAGSLAPEANIYQVFGSADYPIVTDLNTEFSDVLSPSVSEFSSTGGSNSNANVGGLEWVSVITISASICSTGGLGSAWSSDLQQAAARGITVLASSGDTATNVVCDPADMAFNDYGNIAVGGTTLTVNPSTLARTSEVGWFSLCPTNGAQCWGSVGGVSSRFAEPSWQADSANVTALLSRYSISPGRVVADLAAIANMTVIYITVGTSSALMPVGGTSVSSPLIAGMFASLEAYLKWDDAATPLLGFVDPSLYQWGQEEVSGTVTPAPFYDITVGYNTVTSSEAGAGYDMVTGWGVPDASNLAALLAPGFFEVEAGVHLSGTVPIPAFNANQGDLLYLAIVQDYSGGNPPFITDPSLTWALRSDGASAAYESTWIYTASVQSAGLSGHTLAVTAADGAGLGYLLVDIRGAAGFDTALRPPASTYAGTSATATVSPHTGAFAFEFVSTVSSTKAVQLSTGSGFSVLNPTLSPSYAVGLVWGIAGAGTIAVPGGLSAAASGWVIADTVDLRSGYTPTVLTLDNIDNGYSGAGQALSPFSVDTGDMLYLAIAEDWDQGTPPSLSATTLPWVLRTSGAANGEAALWVYTASVTTSSSHADVTVTAADGYYFGILLIDVRGAAGLDPSAVPTTTYYSASTSVGGTADLSAMGLGLAFVSTNAATGSLTLTPDNGEVYIGTPLSPSYDVTLIYANVWSPAAVPVGGSLSTAEAGWVAIDAVDV